MAGSPTCYAFGPVRGDFRLLHALLTQVARVANMDETGAWSWSVERTTLIFLGNWTGRYGSNNLNRMNIPTERAIEDEKKVLDCFRQLARGPKECRLITLIGDQEAARLLSWDSYERFHMADPANEADQEANRLFVSEHLKPFCQTSGIVAGWGEGANTAYFSHGSLELSWFKSWKPKSLLELNMAWRTWLRTGRTRQLRRFMEPTSPLLGTRMEMVPGQWANEDQPTLARVLGIDPHPKFVTAHTPVQVLQVETWDPSIRQVQCPGAGMMSMLASPDDQGRDYIFYLNNLMADVFCVDDDSNRMPQALKFKMLVNRMDQGLAIECEALVMGALAYARYQDQLPFDSCTPEPVYGADATGQMAADEMDGVRRALEEKQTGIDQPINWTGLVLVDDDGKVLMLDDDGKKVVPMGMRDKGRPAFQEMLGMFYDRTGFEGWVLSDKGQEADVRGGPTLGLGRVYVKKLEGRKAPVGTWVAPDNLLNLLTTAATRNILCTLMKHDKLPKPANYLVRCPDWIVN